MRVLSSCLLLASLYGGGLAAVAQQNATEEQVKAAYLYNFGKFASWPDAPKDTFNLCVIGDNPFHGALEATIANETISGARVRVVPLSASQDAASCKIAFIAASEKGRLASLLPRLTHAHVLTVSDTAGFLERGRMIALVREGERVRFSVNMQAVDQAGISLSSELLKVAKQVQR
ncbi:MAG: hypothetical protein NVS9B15_15600 [Acidobacteriaceae bacterium]